MPPRPTPRRPTHLLSFFRAIFHRVILQRALLLCVLAGGILGQSLSAQTCPDGWTYLPGPAPQNDNVFRGVVGFDSDDVWAVGSARNSSLNDTFSLVGHFDGESWSQVASPSPGIFSGGGINVTLYAVGGVAPDDVWALGTYKTQHEVDFFVGFQSLALHWDGSSWQQVDTPQTPVGGTGAFLYDIFPVASDDIWAVGTRVAPDFGAVGTVGLVLHWDGSTWTELPTPPIVSVDQHVLYDLEVFAPDDVVAVGGHSSGGFGPPDTPYAVRWNGSEWSLVEGIPTPGLQNFVKGMAATSGDDIWLAGHVFETSSQPFLVHFDGTSWQRVVADGTWPFAELRAVTARATDDVWAVGVYTEEPPPAVGKKLILHYDGTSWTQVAADAAGPLDGTLWDVAASLNGELWTVGGDSAAAPPTERLCEQMIFHDSFESGDLGSWTP